jgi:hypothetical protein
MRCLAPTLSALLAAVAVAACDRGAAPGADSARTTGSTVQAPPSRGAASTPLPVAPAGLTNSSTAGKGNDLSNSTRASGGSNVYQPPSSDNPAPNPTAAAPASAASQSISSQTRGTSPPPNDGTLPVGTEGNSGSRRGGGKG